MDHISGSFFILPLQSPLGDREGAKEGQTSHSRDSQEWEERRAGRESPSTAGRTLLCLYLGKSSCKLGEL